jgi:hypothetical protein
MSDPVPAVVEATATGEAAAIFADIRATYRIGVVNLIWRHLATFEGALPWAWRSLKPLYVSGHVEGAAAAIRAARPIPRPPALPEATWRCAGLDAQSEAAVRGVVTAYDRTNPMALVALTLLRESLDPGFAAEGTPRAPITDSAPEIPLPPLPAMEALPPHVAAQVRALNRMGAEGAPQIIASMYRHLTHWPASLALCRALLAPLDADGALLRAVDATKALARAEARRLAPLLPRLTPPPDVPRVAAALEAFTGEAIVRMVVNGGVLLSAFSPAPRTASSSP